MTASAHLALLQAIEDMGRAQRESGAWLSRELGCGRGGLAVVRLLGDGPRQVGELAHALRVDVSVASRQVAALVDAGVVERDVAADDRRVRTVALTDVGRALAARSVRASLDLAATVFADWSDDEVAAAVHQFHRVADAVVAHHAAATGPPEAATALPPPTPTPEREIA